MKRERGRKNAYVTAAIWVALVLGVVLVAFVLETGMERAQKQAQKAEAETYATLGERAVAEGAKESAQEEFDIAGGSAVKEFGKGETYIEYGDICVSVNYPVTGIDNIDAEITRTTEKIRREFDKFLQDQEVEGEYIAELNTDYEAYMANEKLGSVYFETDMYLEGAARASHTVKTLNFDFETGEVIAVRDMLKSGGLEKLAELCKKIMLEQMEDVNANDIDDTGLYAEYENFENLLLTREGLRVIFNEYQILSGFYGVVSVTIPYNEIEDYLNLDQLGMPMEEVSPKVGKYNEAETPPTQEEPEAAEMPMVALTFSDGPSDDYTEDILDVLEENNAHATFFVIGNKIRGREALLQRMEAIGCEVGNHGTTHRNLANTTVSQGLLEFKVTNSILEEADVLGHTASLVRMPYCNSDADVTAELPYPVIDRSVDSDDVSGKTAQEIAEKVVNEAVDGSIIELHDTEANTAEAMEKIVTGLKEKGFRLVTVTELLTYDGNELDAGQVYSSK